MPASHQQRRTVRYTGHVQGVGFRYTVRAFADRYPVAGYVKNLPDGSVELVVEGQRESLEQLLGDIRERFAGQIRQELADTQGATAEFARFEIRF